MEALRPRRSSFGRPIFAWMARADLFVLSSDHEGSPNALIEAQGLGVPAVATDCPFGPSEIVEPGRPLDRADDARIRIGAHAAAVVEEQPQFSPWSCW